MMEFWPEPQGQPSLYAKFGTVPGRNCTHNYHDRHQPTHSPFYYGAQQDQGRESSYWTVPGSRTGGGLHDYASWVDPELSAQTSSHFPFILDRHTRQHQGLGEYQPHEARGREWSTAQRAAREYERGFLREGWQRRWEPSNPVHYNREVSAKRSDSSYRELEAWAARYSHSLPRRRHREAELRGASHVLLESGRAPERRRSGTDPQVAVLQQARQSASTRESGAWDRGGRQQTATYYPQQVPESGHVLDSKEPAGYQRRMFSHPPGYIAPPPYDSPHKSSPVVQHCEGMQHHYWSQPALTKQDARADVQDKTKAEDFTKAGANENCAELEAPEHRGAGSGGSQGDVPVGVQSSRTRHEWMSSPQQPQLVLPVQDTKTRQQTSSKVIEGRKFRLNKKTGGLTIFCLVSRISGPAESSSLPLRTSQANTESTGFGGVCKGPRDDGDRDETQKLADEVDFRVPALTEQSDSSDGGNVEAKREAAPACTDSEVSGDSLSKKTETGEGDDLNDANSTFGRQPTPPVHPGSVKYPLWREPSFTSRAEADGPSTVSRANSEEVQSDDACGLGESSPVHPISVEVDVDKDAQSEDAEGLLVIDTTCVVVKMELIPSPKKDHVHYLGSRRTDDSSARLDQDVLPNVPQISDGAEAEMEEVPEEKEELEGGGDLSSPCVASPSERETLQERAERILGIPLHERITEQQRHTASPLDSRDEEVEPSPETNDIHDATEQLPQDADEGGSHNQLEVDQTEDSVDLPAGYEEEDQVPNGDGKHFVELQEQVPDVSEERVCESQLETNIQPAQEAEMAEDNVFEQTENGTTEQSPAGDPLDESDPSQLSDSCLLPQPELTSLSEVSTEEGLSPQLAANLVPHPDPSSLPDAPAAATEHSPSSSPHGAQSPVPSPPPDLQDQMSETMSTTETQDEEEDTLQPGTNEMSDPDDPGEQQPLECEQPPDAACEEESSSTEEQQAKVGDSQITDILGQCLEMSRQDAPESNISQQQSQCVQAEECACTTGSHVTDEQEPDKASEDPAELSGMTVAADQSDVGVEDLPQDFAHTGRGEASCGTERAATAEQLLNDNSEDTHFSVHTQEILTDTTTDSETQAEAEIVQQHWTNVSCEVSPETGDAFQTDEEPTVSHEDAADDQTQAEPLQEAEAGSEAAGFTLLPPSDSTASQAPPDVPPPSEPSTEAGSPLDVEPALSPLTADAGLPETVPPAPLLDSCGESPEVSSSSIDESAQNQSTPLTSAPPPEGAEDDSSDQPHKGPQYPKSLLDAVNRIRKHTAPDSENEEEEASEQWDPESTAADFSRLDVLFVTDSGTIVFDDAGRREGSTGGFVEQESGSRAEDDTLSCSSNSSGDTIVVAEEDETEETAPDAATESEGERCCSREVKDDEDEEAEEELIKGDRTALGLSGECSAEGEILTAEERKITEMEQGEVEEDSPPSQVTKEEAVTQGKKQEN